MTKHSIPAREVREGDRLDRSGKTRVAKIHARDGRILAQTRTRGTRSPSIAAWDADAIVTVYRMEG